MGLLDHGDTYPCPHSDCTGAVKIIKSNITGKVKRMEHIGGDDL